MGLLMPSWLHWKNVNEPIRQYKFTTTVKKMLQAKPWKTGSGWNGTYLTGWMDVFLE